MTMGDRDGFIWMDGEYRPWRDAKVHVLTHTLHYGMGVYEGIRAYKTDRGTAIFRLQDHIDRFFESAKLLKMKINHDKQELFDVAIEVVRKNKLQSAYIRPMCFYGDEGIGLHTNALKSHVIMASWEWGSYLGSEGMEKGVTVGTSSYRRHSINSVLCKAKANGNYITSMLALQEAQAGGYDEALFLDQHGFICEGSGEHIFVIKDKIIMTPFTHATIDGITRESIMTLAAERGYTVVEKNMTRDELYLADEAFFTGTAAEVTPIRAVDGRDIGSGGRGPISKEIQALYFDQVYGRHNENQEWLTYI